MSKDLDLDSDARLPGPPVAESRPAASRRWFKPMSSPRSRWRAVGDALTIAGIVYIALVWLRVFPYAPPVPDYGPMFDARAYWTAWQGGMYDTPWLVNGAYSYSPAFAQLIWPLTLLPWPVFAAGYTLGCIACLFWMRVPWMIAFPGVIDDILRGNIHVFLAASIVLAIRGFPAAWTFGIIAKVTPGIGILWHVVRGEWRNTAIALGVPFVIVAISFAARAGPVVRVVRLPGDERRRIGPHQRASAAAPRPPANRRRPHRLRGTDRSGLDRADRRDDRPPERLDHLDRSAGWIGLPLAVRPTVATYG